MKKIVFAIDSSGALTDFNWVNNKAAFKNHIKNFTFIETDIIQQGIGTCYLHAIETATFLAQNSDCVNDFLDEVKDNYEKEEPKSIKIGDKYIPSALKQEAFECHIKCKDLPLGLEQSLNSTGTLLKLLAIDPIRQKRYSKVVENSKNKTFRVCNNVVNSRLTKADLKTYCLTLFPGALSSIIVSDNLKAQYCSSMQFDRLCWLFREYSQKIMQNDSYKIIKIPLMHHNMFKSLLPIPTLEDKQNKNK